MSETPTVEELFTEYGEQLKERARRILGSDADADDIVQEVMLTLITAPHILAGVERITGWLLTVVHRRCVDLIRAGSRRREAEPGDVIELLLEGGDDPAHVAEQEETASHVAEAISELPEDLREVFVANSLHGISYREISEQTGTPMGTLMARKKKAVETLRDRLRSRGFLPRHRSREHGRENGP